MNILYVKTLLYLYPCVGKICDDIDKIVLNKAICSMSDFSPCENQCEKIIDLTEEKKILILAREIVSDCLKIFDNDELDCLDYKYFKQKPKKYYENFDSVSRKYFRKQVRIVVRLSKLLNRKGYDDEWFNGKLMHINFVSSMYGRVKIKENSSVKTPKKTMCVQSALDEKKTA